MYSVSQKVQEKYEGRGWTKHHEQSLEFEEQEDESREVVTLSIAGPKSQDDKWELLPVTPLKVRNVPPHLLTAWHCVCCSLIAGLQQIKKWKVDRMKRKSNPPHCRLAIKWRGEARRKLPDVSRQVDLKGAISEEDYFSIQLPERGMRHLSFNQSRPTNECSFSKSGLCIIPFKNIVPTYF